MQRASSVGGALLRQRLAAVKSMLPTIAQLHSNASNSPREELMKRRMMMMFVQQKANLWGDSIAKWKMWGRSDYGMPPPVVRRIDGYQRKEYDMTKHPEHDRHTLDNPASRQAGVPPQFDLRRSGLFHACMVGEGLNKQLQAPLNVHIPKFYKDKGQCVLIEPKHTRDHRVPPNPGFTNDTYRRFLTFCYFMLFDLIFVYLYLMFDFFIMAFDMLWSFWRIDIWVDRTGRNRRLPPWDWERARENYTKLPQFWFNFIGSSVQGATSKKEYVYDLNEALQDKMLEAARASGTR